MESYHVASELVSHRACRGTWASGLWKGLWKGAAASAGESAARMGATRASTKDLGREDFPLRGATTSMEAPEVWRRTPL